MTDHIIHPQKLFKVLVVGDSCVDEYQYGHVDRLSPEAPVPVFQCDTALNNFGMGANVAKNLTVLGC